jgi:mono/diheme cytochrome c family protein
VKRIGLTTVVFGVALFAAPILAQAQQATDIGKQEYENSCAVCHGIDATGNGPLAILLRKRPGDLTKLAKRNAGVFPFDQVYRIIDGRDEVASHGPRNMPVWGATFSREEAKKMGSGMFGSTQNLESLVRGRIVALVGYIYSLQQPK